MEKVLALPNSVLPLTTSALASIFVANRVSLPFFDANLATRNLGGIPAITFSDSAIEPVMKVMKVADLSLCLPRQITLRQLLYMATTTNLEQEFFLGGQKPGFVDLSCHGLLEGSITRSNAQKLLKQLDPEGKTPDLEIDLMDPKFQVPPDGSEPLVEGNPVRVAPDCTVKDVYLLMKESDGVVYVTDKGILQGSVTISDLMSRPCVKAKEKKRKAKVKVAEPASPREVLETEKKRKKKVEVALEAPPAEEVPKKRKKSKKEEPEAVKEPLKEKRKSKKVRLPSEEPEPSAPSEEPEEVDSRRKRRRKKERLPSSDERAEPFPAEAGEECVRRLRGWIGELQDLSELFRGVVPAPRGLPPASTPGPPPAEPPPTGATPKAPPAGPPPAPAASPGGEGPLAASGSRSSPGDHLERHSPRVKAEDHQRHRSPKREERKSKRKTRSPERKRRRERGDRSPPRLASPVRPEGVPREASPSDDREALRRRNAQPRSPEHSPPRRERKERPAAEGRGPGSTSLMPPKLRRPAAAKAGAKAKGAPRRRVVRRPAREEGEADAAEEIVKACDLSLEGCRKLHEIVVKEGTFWGAPVTAALRVKDLRMKGGELYLVCAPHANDLIHLVSFARIGRDKEEWMTNLEPSRGEEEGEDALDELRRDHRRVQGPPDRGGEEKRPEEVRRTPSRDRSRRRKRSRSRRKKRAPLKIESRKELKVLFMNTGLDPDPAVRKRFRRRAAKIVRRKKKDSDEGSGSSSGGSTSQSFQDPSLFGSANRVQSIGRRLPGVLTSASLEEAAEGMVTNEGGVWNTQDSNLPAIFGRYYKQKLQGRMTPAMSREAFTLSTLLDLGLRGRVAELMDLASQRLKALEMQSQGVHFTVSQQHELLQKEGVSMATTQEFQSAARLAREEGRARLEASRPYGTRSSMSSKGDDQVKGSGKKGYGKMGKGGKNEGKKGETDKGDTKKNRTSIAEDVKGEEPLDELTRSSLEMAFAGVDGSSVEPGPPPGDQSEGPGLVGMAGNPAENSTFDSSGGSMKEMAAKSDIFSFHRTDAGRCRPLTLAGAAFSTLGDPIFNALLPLIWTRSGKTMTMATDSIFPLPLEGYELVPPEQTGWLKAVLTALNSLYGSGMTSSSCPSPSQKRVASTVLSFLSRMWEWKELVPQDTFEDFFNVRGVDYRGEEIKLARSFNWECIAGALPQEVGTLCLEEFCVGGCRHYVESFENFLLPSDQLSLGKAPRVMVSDSDWDEVCEGLIQTGICRVLPRSQLFHLGDRPLLNGLFAVTKGEYQGTLELHRLIMNMVPLNNLCRPLRGDVATLPAVSSFNAFFLEDHEVAVMASEDIKCFYYLFTIPAGWQRFMGFNRVVPAHLVPTEYKGSPCHLVAQVLPMGFINSVGLAQHIHRNVVRWARESTGEPGGGEQELRRDRPATLSKEVFRVYLDNWDEIRKVDVTLVEEVEGQPSPQQQVMRDMYAGLQLPRHPKKAVWGRTTAEIQGALLDGRSGVAYARPSKVMKYLGLAWELVHRNAATQRELQVVAGGLVYITMFRRSLLCSLNATWRHIETMKGEPPVVRRALPREVSLELMRFLALIPLAQMDFRLPMRPQVTASDASTTGGGICASVGLSSFGHCAQSALVRGDVQEPFEALEVLTVGLFDGIGALRVAVDLLHVAVAGHISVECNAAAQRVVECAFPGTWLVDNIQSVTDEEVMRWACEFTSVGVVLIGAGPPCQDVSGLNVDRRGSQKGLRSSLYKEVPRIKKLVQKRFPWAQVLCFIESVASMDEKDRSAMSQDLGMTPYQVDAGDISLARRPRLYWLDWELVSETGMLLKDPVGHGWSLTTPVQLSATLEERDFLQPGWHLPPGRKLPTFTTARPSTKPGRRPAGLHTCDAEAIARWRTDLHRFPPYQYRADNCNTWSVPVVTILLKQMFERLGFVEAVTVQTLVDRSSPGGGERLQSVLQRPPVHRERPGVFPDQGLASRLASLVSTKGEDLMLQATSEPMAKHQKVRHTVPSKLWRWKEVTGWQWRCQGDHINQLELRAVLTTVQWLVQKNQVRKGLGSLKQLTLQPRTRIRYDKAKKKFYDFLDNNSLVLPRARSGLDPILCDYLEHLWSSGEGRALASDTLAALQDASPKIRGSIPGAWRLLKTWHVNEIPHRALPMPERVLLSLAGYFLFHKNPRFALSLLLAFYGMLRTGELLGIRNKDVTIDDRQTTAVIALGYTKGGKRSGAAESVTVSVRDVVWQPAKAETEGRSKGASFKEGAKTYGTDGFSRQSQGVAHDASSYGRTALHFASTKQTARALLRALADDAGMQTFQAVNAPDVHGQRPLHQAVLNKHQEVLLELLKANADVDARSITAKHIEVHLERPSLQQVWGLQWRPDFLRRQRRIVEQVLEQTPLSRWNEEQKATGAEILRAGAELLEADGQAGSGAQQVLRNARKLRLLFRQGDPLIGDSPVHLAVRQGDASLLAQLLVARGDPDALGAGGETAFELAAGQPELLEVPGVPSAWVDPARAAEWAVGSRATYGPAEVCRDLHYAARQGDASTVEQLINSFADVDGRRGTRTLQLELLREPGEERWGFEWKDHQSRRILEDIDSSSDELVEVNGRRGWHEISQLRRWHQVTLIFELVTHETPLAVAAEHGHLKVVTSLLAARADPRLHWQGKEIFMELQRPHLTASWGFVWDQRFDGEFRRVLTAMCEDSPAADWNQDMLDMGQDPWSCFQRSTQNWEDVLHSGDELIMINERDARTMVGMKTTSFFALRELLEIRLCFQRVRRSVLTPLERAADQGHHEVCNALLTAGVDAKVRANTEHPTPLEIFTDTAQAVIQLKVEKELVLAFLVGINCSWETVRQEVQRRLKVSRASFFSQGRELADSKGLVVEDHILTFNLVFRDRLLTSLKSGDLETAFPGQMLPPMMHQMPMMMPHPFPGQPWMPHAVPMGPMGPMAHPMAHAMPGAVPFPGQKLRGAAGAAAALAQAQESSSSSSDSDSSSDSSDDEAPATATAPAAVAKAHGPGLAPAQTKAGLEPPQIYLSPRVLKEDCPVEAAALFQLLQPARPSSSRCSKAPPRRPNSFAHGQGDLKLDMSADFHHMKPFECKNCDA
eukprot:s2412_g5.t1